jgi:hypothetical protein
LFSIFAPKPFFALLPSLDRSLLLLLTPLLLLCPRFPNSGAEIALRLRTACEGCLGGTAEGPEVALPIALQSLEVR